MSPTLWATILAAILLAPPAMIFTFTNVFAPGDLYIFHGGSNVNEAPVPIAGAGLVFLFMSVGVYAIARRFRRLAD